MFTVSLFLNSALLGVGLAMDAFSVSLANGLNEHNMGRTRMLGIAGTFAGFQFAMPMIGWFCVHAIAEKFVVFQNFVPWIALALLLFIGSKMLMEGVVETKKNRSPSLDANASVEIKKVAIGALMMQGIATSIDALSVGFTIANYNAIMAFIASLIIGIVTYIICMLGLALGKKFGTIFAGKASILGGIILIGIGIEIWVSGVIL